MKQHIFIFILLVAGIVCLPAQEQVTIDDVVTGKAEVTATNTIILSHGFHAVSGSNFHAYIDASAVDNTPTSTAVTSASVSGTPTDGQNYIRSITMREAYSNKTQDVDNYAHNEDIQYFDGLGRPSQVIQVNASPNGHDIVQPIVYDDFGREAEKYLPYVDENNGGAYVGTAIAACKTYYNTDGGIAGKDHDAKPYSITGFDGSPLNRVMSQLGAGEDWHTGNKAVSYSYATNGSAINSWDEEGASDPFPAYSLYITQITDENGHITKEYKDKLGQVVLKESIEGSNTLQTFYIYDDFGLLRTVVPPKAASPADTELCYFYTYDGRKRMISKDIPGADIVYMVYDKRDRLVLTQDGNMRNANEYLFTKYDQLNRPVMTGTITITKDLDSETDGIRKDFREDDGDLYETFDQSGDCYGYTKNNSFPDDNEYQITKNDVHTVTWYDDYTFIDVLTSQNIYDFGTYTSPSGYVGSKSDKTKGVATGTLVKPLKVDNSGLDLSAKELVSVSYFDDYGNVIKSISNNHKDGFDIIHSQYEDITYQVLKTFQEHKLSASDTNPLQIAKEFKYDHVGRLLETKCQINDEDEIVLNASRYNELGELITKYLHSEDASDNDQKAYVQKVDYTYNIRGWMTSINDPGLGDDNDLFGMRLCYNDISNLNSTTVPTTSKQYNGNIAAMVWGTKGDDVQIRGYGFDYDGINRLTDARYAESSTLASNKGKYTVDNISYDKNGNINSLNRKFEGTLADQLIYTYNTKSNQLKRVSDPQGDIADVADYAVRSTSDYTYDDNGNMTFDPGKNTHVSYNFLNLPECVSFSTGGKIYYHYDAAGNKLAKTVESSSSSVDETTDYIANLVYTNGQKSFFSTEEGRAIPITSNGTTRWHFEYNLKDHLGNTRVTFGGSSIGGSADIVQTSSYYPFGMVMAQTNYNTGGSNYQQNKYLYNGKEFQDDGFGGVSLDWYDYGKRFYDPAIARWHAIDPRAEKYDEWSPYNYVVNNPLVNVDPNGDTISFYLIAQYKNNLPQYSSSSAANATQVGDYSVTPYYDADGNVVGYGATNADGELVYVMNEASDLQTFQDNIGNYSAAANLFYSGGTPSEGQIAWAAGDTWKGLGKMWGDALTSPEYYMYVATSFAMSAKTKPNIKKPYKRPSNATTPAQRASVQGKPCVDCGTTGTKMYADHKYPLVREYYETGKINVVKMRDVKSVQPQCGSCSSSQGGKLSNYSKQMKKKHGL